LTVTCVIDTMRPRGCGPSLRVGKIAIDLPEGPILGPGGRWERPARCGGSAAAFPEGPGAIADGSVATGERAHGWDGTGAIGVGIET